MSTVSLDEQVTAIKTMARDYSGTVKVYRTALTTMSVVLSHEQDADMLLGQLRTDGWLTSCVRKGQYTPFWYVYVRLNQVN